MPALFWLSCYVASHCLAVAPQSGAEQNFCCTAYYITLNSKCIAQRASKNLKKIVENRVKKPKLKHEWFECKIFTFQRRNYV